MSDFKKLATLLSFPAVVETVSDYDGKKKSDFYPNADEDGMVDVSDYPFTYSTTVKEENKT